MAKQTTYADCDFEPATKRSRKQVFLEELNSVVPLARPVSVILGCVQIANSDRPPFPIDVMLRIQFHHPGNNCTYRAIDEARPDMHFFRGIVGLDTRVSRLPDKSTILLFRPFFETVGHSKIILVEVNGTL